MTKKIFLLGFMGSGKSYVGKRLAEQFQVDFLDLDELIVEKSGLPISEIFALHGEAYFRQLESQCLKSLENSTNKIVALGGGTPCFFDNMEWINRNGVSIYLETSLDVLLKRLTTETAKRPLLQQLSEEALPIFIQKKIAERNPFYEQAHLQYFTKTGDEPIIAELRKFFYAFF